MAKNSEDILDDNPYLRTLLLPRLGKFGSNASSPSFVTWDTNMLCFTPNWVF